MAPLLLVEMRDDRFASDGADPDAEAALPALGGSNAFKRVCHRLRHPNLQGLIESGRCSHLRGLACSTSLAINVCR